MKNFNINLLDNLYETLEVNDLYDIDQVGDVFRLVVSEESKVNLFKGSNYPVLLKVSSDEINEFTISSVEVSIRDKSGTLIDKLEDSGYISIVIDNDRRLAGFIWNTEMFEVSQYLIHMWITIMDSNNHEYKLSSGNISKSIKSLAVII